MDTMVSAVPPHVDPALVVDFDIYRDAGLLEDVHLAYSALQRRVPDVFYTPRNGGHWVATRHDIIAQIVRSPEHFSTQQMNIPYNPNPPVFIPLSLDPPDNIPFRQLLQPIFAAKSVREMEPDLKAFADELIDRVADRGECDFLEDIAAHYPVGVFMRLMGLPMEKHAIFRRLAEEHFAVSSPEEMRASMADITGELGLCIAERQREPRDDLLSQLIAAELKDGRRLTDNELMSMVQLLFLAGLDTVTNVMTFGCRHVARDPALQERLRGNPAEAGAFAEEVIRMFGVVNTPRLVVEDIDLAGARFRKGDMVLSILSLAGRDDRHNDDPLRFDLDREARTHLTFSTGPHLCLGHALARTELRIFYEQWFSRMPAFRVADDRDPGSRAGLVMALDSLPLRWDADVAPVRAA